MPLATSGTISIGGSTANRSINLELSRAATATSSLGETSLRTLAGVASGAISMSNFYGKAAGSLVSPMVGVPGTSWSNNSTEYLSATATAQVSIWMTNDGQIWIQQGVGAPRNGAPTSAWWSTATYVFGGGVSGIGSSYWVRFTRTAFTGATGASTGTTGWLSLANDQSAQVLVTQSSGATGIVQASATYTIEVASTSAGGAPTSTTTGITISASADSDPNSPP